MFDKQNLLKMVIIIIIIIIIIISYILKYFYNVWELAVIVNVQKSQVLAITSTCI